MKHNYRNVQVVCNRIPQSNRTLSMLPKGKKKQRKESKKNRKNRIILSMAKIRPLPNCAEKNKICMKKGAERIVQPRFACDLLFFRFVGRSGNRFFPAEDLFAEKQNVQSDQHNHHDAQHNKSLTCAVIGKRSKQHQRKTEHHCG